MEIITSLEAVKTEYSPSVIALGTFDGLHLGHQDIIKTARDYAQKHGLKLIVFTFSNRPSVSYTHLTLPTTERV